MTDEQQYVALRDEDWRKLCDENSALIKQLTSERRELEGQLEVERQRLTACLLAAHGAGDEQFVGMLPEYDSKALRATRLLWKNHEALRAAALALKEQVAFNADAADLWTAEFDAAIERLRAVLDNPLGQWTAPAVPEPGR